MFRVFPLSTGLKLERNLIINPLFHFFRILIRNKIFRIWEKVPDSTGSWFTTLVWATVLLGSSTPREETSLLSRVKDKTLNLKRSLTPTLRRKKSITSTDTQVPVQTQWCNFFRAVDQHFNFWRIGIKLLLSMRIQIQLLFYCGSGSSFIPYLLKCFL